MARCSSGALWRWRWPVSCLGGFWKADGCDVAPPRYDCTHLVTHFGLRACSHRCAFVYARVFVRACVCVCVCVLLFRCCSSSAAVLLLCCALLLCVLRCACCRALLRTMPSRGGVRLGLITQTTLGGEVAMRYERGAGLPSLFSCAVSAVVVFEVTSLVCSLVSFFCNRVGAVVCRAEHPSMCVNWDVCGESAERC